MNKKHLAKKLSLNKTTIARLNLLDMDQLFGGALFPRTIGGICPTPDSIAGANTCIYTDGDLMYTCPETMTLCGELYCP